MGGTPTTHQQFIHGTQYIDEVVMARAIDKGDLYIHQDANWNVIGTTDLAASVVERNVYTLPNVISRFNNRALEVIQRRLFLFAAKLLVDLDIANEFVGQPGCQEFCHDLAWDR